MVVLCDKACAQRWVDRCRGEGTSVTVPPSDRVEHRLLALVGVTVTRYLHLGDQPLSPRIGLQAQLGGQPAVSHGQLKCRRGGAARHQTIAGERIGIRIGSRGAFYDLDASLGEAQRPRPRPAERR